MFIDFHEQLTSLTLSGTLRPALYYQTQFLHCIMYILHLHSTLSAIIIITPNIIGTKTLYLCLPCTLKSIFFHTGSKEDQCKGRENGINCCRVCSHSFYRRVTWHAGFLWFVSNSSRWETNVGKFAQRFRSIILFFSYQEFRKGWLWLLSGSHSCKQEKNGCVFESCFTRTLFCLLLKYLHIKDCWTFVYI